MSLSRIALGVLGGIALSASSAMAADLAAYVPPPADWTGAYFGGGVCYDWANFDVTQEGKKKHTEYKKIKETKRIPYEKTVTKKIWTPHGYVTKTFKETHYRVVEFPKTIKIVRLVDFEKTFEGTASAPCATVTIGYDYQIDPLWVVGVFASYDWQSKKGDLYKVRYGELTDHVAGDIWLGNIATIAGRAGMLVTPKVLVYALVGWSWTDGGYSLYNKSYASALNGPTVGAGVEAILWKRLSGRLEYRFTDFGKMTNSGGSYCEPYTNTASVTDQSVRLVLTYKL